MKEAESPQARQAQAPKLHHAVFISYSSDDEGIAGAVCSALEAEAIQLLDGARVISKADLPLPARSPKRSGKPECCCWS